jgi:hypothetical protein
MIGRSWFVTEKSIIDHKSTVNESGKNKGKEKEKKSAEFPPPISAIILPSYQNVPELFKYEIEEKPLIPELKSKSIFLPTSFAIPSLSTTNAGLQSANVNKDFYSSFNPKYILLIVSFVIASSFIFVPSLISKNTLSNASQSVASLANFSTGIINFVSNRILGLSNYLAELVTGKPNQLTVNNSVIVNNNSPETVSNGTPVNNFNGMAVVPSTNSPEKDDLLKKQIRDSFSDEVKVQTDKNGTAGVITPVFKKAKSGDFIYVLVPLKESKQ